MTLNFTTKTLKTTLKKRNSAVILAWGSVVTGTYLGFNLKQMTTLADDKGVDLWNEMLKVDAEEEFDGKVLLMEELLERLKS